MKKAIRILTAAALGSTLGSLSLAQTLPPGNPGARPATIRPPVTGPAIAGTWSGTVLQIQRSIEYAVTVEITAQGAQTNYPELHCGGKLSRIGVSRDYAFFVETITTSPVDDNGRCSNGTITMARAGDDLVWGWFGLVKGEVVTAHGTLRRKSDADQPVAEDVQSITATPAPRPRKPRPPTTPLAPPMIASPR